MSVRSSRSENDAGFTLVELIVALALLGTLLLVVWAAASGGIGAVARIGLSVERTDELLQLDEAVRWEVARIDVPYWVKEAKVDARATEVRLSYLDGDPKRSIDFAYTKGLLTIDDGKHRLVFGGLIRVTMAVGEGEGGGAPRFTLVARFRGGGSDTIVAPFSAYPFPIVGP